MSDKTPLQTALSKFKSPFRCNRDRMIVDQLKDPIAYIFGFISHDDEDEIIIGSAIADFLNAAVQKTDTQTDTFNTKRWMKEDSKNKNTKTKMSDTTPTRLAQSGTQI